MMGLGLSLPKRVSSVGEVSWLPPMTSDDLVMKWKTTGAGQPLGPSAPFTGTWVYNAMVNWYKEGQESSIPLKTTAVTLSSHVPPSGYTPAEAGTWYSVTSGVWPNHGWYFNPNVTRLYDIVNLGRTGLTEISAFFAYSPLEQMTDFGVHDLTGMTNFGLQTAFYNPASPAPISIKGWDTGSACTRMHSMFSLNNNLVSLKIDNKFDYISKFNLLAQACPNLEAFSFDPPAGTHLTFEGIDTTNMINGCPLLATSAIGNALLDFFYDEIFNHGAGSVVVPASILDIRPATYTIATHQSKIDDIAGTGYWTVLTGVGE